MAVTAYELLDPRLQQAALLLQSDPFFYRYFGVWWWPIKALFRDAGFKQGDGLAFGPYIDEDPDFDAVGAELGSAEVITAALAHQHGRFAAGGDLRTDLLGDRVVSILDHDIEP